MALRTCPLRLADRRHVPCRAFAIACRKGVLNGGCKLHQKQMPNTALALTDTVAERIIAVEG